MTPEELSESRWELLYRAEYSTRYHRRRSAFFRKLDTFLTLVVITAGASAFADLVAGSPGRIAQVGTAAVTLISIAQVVLRLGQSAIMHSQWLKRWNSLRTQISLKTAPVLADIERWSAEKALIEEECIGELRALALDCEDAAARVMKMPGRQHYINPIQRFFIHFGTFQQNYQGPRAASPSANRAPGEDDQEDPDVSPLSTTAAQLFHQVQRQNISDAHRPARTSQT